MTGMNMRAEAILTRKWPVVSLPSTLHDGSPIGGMLVECPECYAVVRDTSRQEHAEWHAGETVRSFLGF